MKLLSILQSVLPVKKDCDCRFTACENNCYNTCLSDLTDRLSKAEFLIDKVKLVDIINAEYFKSKDGYIESGTLSEAISAQLPSLLSVVEKNADLLKD